MTDQQQDALRFEMGPMTSEVMTVYGTEVAWRIDGDQPRRMMLVAIAIALLGAIGAELGVRTTFRADTDLPLPTDVPDVMRLKAATTMRVLDHVLNQRDDRLTKATKLLRELIETDGGGDAKTYDPGAYLAARDDAKAFLVASQ